MSSSQHYTVLARKYRPKDFNDLIGQDAMVQTLRNAFATGRIAQAYMLTGVRGVGKTTTARILARALNYVSLAVAQATIEISELGEHCQSIMESRHVDVLEMDAASHTGVDNIREIIESARYKPISARYKVYIIDEVHMLSKGAFNALLKTLEEPPEHVKFIFATTEVRKVPVTVLSRCQRFDLRRVGMEQLVAHLQKIAKLEAVEADLDALALLARAAEGSVRDGLSILDQAIALGDGKVTAADIRSMLGLADRTRIFELLEVIFQGNASSALELLDKLYNDGAEPLQLLADMAEAVHLTTRVKVTGGQQQNQGLSEAERNKAQDFASGLSLPVLGRAWQVLLKGLEEADAAPQPIAAVEMIVIRLAYAANLPAPDEVIRKLGMGDPTTASHIDSIAKPNSDPTNSAQPVSSDTRPRMELVSGGAAVAVPAASQEYAPQQQQSLIEGAPELDSFEAVVAFVGQKRDLKLKISLEKYARLVRYKLGHIELHMEENAPSTLANELGQKLNTWTGLRWIVSLSRDQGQKTIAEQKQEKEAKELAMVKDHPMVQKMFEYFPDAEITDIRELAIDILPDPEENDMDNDD